MRGPHCLCLLAMVVLAGGCILEDNPEFMETEGASSTASTSTLGPSSASTGGATDTVDTTMVEPTADSGDSTGDTPPSTGCDDPARCTTYHIGPVVDACPHQVDGSDTSACDFVGSDALRVAVAALEGSGQGGLVVMHDDPGGAAASYVGSVDVPGATTIRAAEGVPPEALRVFSQDTEGVIRLRDHGVHLQGFTVVCRVEGEWGLTTREDLETSGTETGYHLVENLVVAATRPESVGYNATSSPIQSIGPATTVRNTHIWGYFEDSMDMRFAAGSVFSHNTVLYYQPTGTGPTIDARLVDGLEVSNNVFASLGRPAAALVEADDGTTSLVVVGNAVEGYLDILAGLDVGSPEVTVTENSVDPLELESPYRPLLLADSVLTASDLGVAGGTSLDGVPLARGERHPGAYQEHSPLATPRPTLITVGEGTCGADPCVITKDVDNELQRAVWSAWPGATVELHPSGTPYAGPVVVSWPVVLRGASDDPTEAVIRRQVEDATLGADGVWAGKNAVVDLTADMDQPSVVERLTIEAGPGEVGLVHEGGAAVAERHQIRRIVLRDDGIAGGPLADMALSLGDEVIVHDVLVHGGYDTCVRFGPRVDETDPTPTSTAYVHHLTCRLTLASPGLEVAAFEVAAVQDVIIADAVIELPEAGPLFRAQRRSSGDADPTALDVPASFTASAIAARGFGLQYDGFSDVDGVYTLTDVDTVGIMEPLFMSAADSHLEAGALGIDGGVDPATLEPGLSLGIDLDGTSRTGLAVDRGCYEQGL